MSGGRKRKREVSSQNLFELNVSKQTRNILTIKHFPGALLADRLQWYEVYEVLTKVSGAFSTFNEVSAMYLSSDAQFIEASTKCLRVFVQNTVPHARISNVTSTANLILMQIGEDDDDGTLLATALKSQVDGGMLICKFHSNNACFLASVKSFYETTAICKPTCSKPFAPECYAVFRNFKSQPQIQLHANTHDEKLAKTIAYVREKQISSLETLIDDAKHPWKYESEYIFADRQRNFRQEFLLKHRLI